MKIPEKLVYKRTYNFLNNTKQFYNSQYGFRNSHSCEDTVCELTGEVLKNKENGNYTAAVFLDLLKAFDTLEHEELYHKLEKYGIRGTCLDWFKSYLTNRKLRSKCKLTTGTKYSEWYDVEYGTPQGSCLGPLLFLIFCNDLHKNLSFLKCIQFADDTTLYFSHKNKNFVLCYLEHDLEIISDWFSTNKLTLNVDKTVFMLFNPKGKCEATQIKFENQRIQNSHDTKFLGIWLNDNLSWQSHTRQLLLKLKCNMLLLKRGKNMLKTFTLVSIYYAHIHSHLKYGTLIWGSMLTQSQLTKLQKLQNQALKTINPNLPVEDSYQDLKIPDIRKLICLEQQKLGY